MSYMNFKYNEGDRIRFNINFGEDRAYWSENGFEGTVFWDRYRWHVKDVIYTKMYDQKYVFRMQGRSCDKDLLEKYCGIKSISFGDISYIELVTPSLLKNE